METGKFSDNLRVTENGLVSGVDRAFKSSNSTFQNIGDRLNPLGKSVDFDILPLVPPFFFLQKSFAEGISQGPFFPAMDPPLGGVCRRGVCRSPLQKGSLTDLFLPGPGSTPGRSLPKQPKHRCGPMRTSSLPSSVTIHQAVLLESTGNIY